MTHTVLDYPILTQVTTGDAEPVLVGGHHGRDNRPALRDAPAAPERKPRRPNTAPTYYLGHPAATWISAMRPRHSRAPACRLVEATVSSDIPTRNSSAVRTADLLTDRKPS